MQREPNTHHHPHCKDKDSDNDKDNNKDKRNDKDKDEDSVVVIHIFCQLRNWIINAERKLNAVHRELSTLLQTLSSLQMQIR